MKYGNYLSSDIARCAGKTVRQCVTHAAGGNHQIAIGRFISSRRYGLTGSVRTHSCSKGRSPLIPAIDTILSRWGRWVIKSDSKGLGYPSTCPMFRDFRSGEVLEVLHHWGYLPGEIRLMMSTRSWRASVELTKGDAMSIMSSAEKRSHRGTDGNSSKGSVSLA